MIKLGMGFCLALMVAACGPMQTGEQSLQLTEVAYDDKGVDDFEFVEFKNLSNDNIVLNNLRLRIINGSTGLIEHDLSTDNCSSKFLVAGAYLVFGDAAIGKLRSDKNVFCEFPSSRSGSTLGNGGSRDGVSLGDGVVLWDLKGNKILDAIVYARQDPSPLLMRRTLDKSVGEIGPEYFTHWGNPDVGSLIRVQGKGWQPTAKVTPFEDNDFEVVVPHSQRSGRDTTPPF